MGIRKRAGEAWGLRGLTIQHTGPARQVLVRLTLTPAQGYGHADPARQSATRVFYHPAWLPEAAAPTATNVGRVERSWPDGFAPGQAVDVNVAIGPLKPTGPEFWSDAEWYAHRFDDDWDDAAYEVA